MIIMSLLLSVQSMREIPSFLDKTRITTEGIELKEKVSQLMLEVLGVPYHLLALNSCTLVSTPIMFLPTPGLS
jgi:hypothetical protein